MSKPLEPGFPPELLSQPASVRAQYFKDQVVGHHLFEQTLAEIKQAITYAETGQIFLLFGPTGVGKTTLKDKLIKDVLTEALAEMQTDPGWLPIASVKATAQDHRPFDWIDYYSRALLALNEPLIEHKLLYAEEIEFGLTDLKLNGKGQIVAKSATPKLRQLRLALESCLQERRPRVFIVDEAPHLQRVGSGKSLRAQLDTIKSLAERSGTRHLLVGTYELLEFTNLNGQLGRRTREIDFPRYRVGLKEHEKEFKRLLRSFELIIPLPHPPDLVKQWEFIYDHSLGCIGLVKAWLLSALGETWEKDEPTLSDEMLRRHCLPPEKLHVIFREMREGERRLAESRARAEEELQQWLSLDKAPASPLKRSPSAPKRSQKPFERKLGRDAIGGADGR